MRVLIFLLLLTVGTVLGQIKGNGVLETKTFTISTLKNIKIDLNAKVIIDASADEKIIITAESNLFDYIGKKQKGNTIHFDQVKWIEPTKAITIKIGAPSLAYVEQDTHSTTEIININNDKLKVFASVGKIILEGITDQLKIKVRNGMVDATKISAENTDVVITGYGKAKIKTDENLHTVIGKEGDLLLSGKPKKITGNYQEYLARPKENLEDVGEWIAIKIKNNSWKRNHFEVVGPKKSGGKFSYGFSLLPEFTKKERWTTGTKVYKVNKLGMRKLLVTITENDKNKTVNLFKK
ncbi:GIN domain-containing protein [Tenacibaculum agarivorans]|uniref:GIN domain-containing protein n=1 Tax=Tenacibaculum agarivorans TaxID=1908389 RepID=UPI00094BA842|nr:DUF2807 domain-containing protein [Tenacibaculum agarivorans]